MSSEEIIRYQDKYIASLEEKANISKQAYEDNTKLHEKIADCKEKETSLMRETIDVYKQKEDMRKEHADKMEEHMEKMEKMLKENQEKMEKATKENEEKMAKATKENEEKMAKATKENEEKMEKATKKNEKKMEDARRENEKNIQETKKRVFDEVCDAIRNSSVDKQILNEMKRKKTDIQKEAQKFGINTSISAPEMKYQLFALKKIEHAFEKGNDVFIDEIDD